MPITRQTPSAPYPHKTILHPETPITGSPTPWLTSIHATRTRGPYGDSSYRGNCSGYLIKDLIRYFGARRVLDPMTGSGTCRDVCDELGVECVSFDLRQGEDAGSAETYQEIGKFDFVWMHPPYWRMIRYNDDPRCLSSAPDLETFADRMGEVLGHCRCVLAPGGKIAVLMGNFSERGRFQPVTHYTMQAELAQGLWPACTDIVRLQYRNTSSRKSYQSSFIPGVHDTCLVFEVDEVASSQVAE